MRRALLAAGVLLFAAPVRAGEARPFVDVEAWLSARSSEWFTGLEHPQIRCLVSQLLSEPDVAALSSRLHGLRGAEVLAARAPDGSFLWDGGWRGAGNCELGLLWVHPDGVIFGIIREDCGDLNAFTNASHLIAAPPPSVVAWMKGHSRSGKLVPWRVAAESGPAAACSLRALSREIAADEERRAGRRCDEESRFGGAALVAPAGGPASAHLRTDPSCGSGREDAKPYVIAGDLIETGMVSGACTCARYERAGKAVAGWVATERLLAVPSGGASAAPQALPAELLRRLAGLAAPPTLSGTWTCGSRTLTIAQDEAGSWSVIADGNVGYQMGNVEAGLVRDGRLAWSAVAAGDDASDCHIAILQANDALWVQDDASCGGQGFSFDGIYRRQKPPRTR